MIDEVMVPLERFEVECEDKEGAKKYKEVISDVLMDLNLVRAIGRLEVFIDPKEPVFIVVGLFRRGLPTLHLSDVADIASVNEGLLVSVQEEQYSSNIVGKLFLKYGRENVIQTDRTSVIVPLKGDFAKQYDDIAAMVVYDPQEDMKKNIIEALLRITPEGFRVRKHNITQKSLSFIASEDPIKPEWLAKCRNIYDKLTTEA